MGLWYGLLFSYHLFDGGVKWFMDRSWVPRIAVDADSNTACQNLFFLKTCDGQDISIIQTPITMSITTDRSSYSRFSTSPRGRKRDSRFTIINLIFFNPPDIRYYEWERGDGGMFKVLLIEDNPIFRKYLKSILSFHFTSMVIIEAGNGLEASREFVLSLPDIIFMDIQLPGENGLELTKKIKTGHPEITVIILTSHDLPEFREAAAQKGADYYFVKDSTTSDEIVALVKKILLEKGFNINGSNGTTRS
jgi:CheY-like chemotaxis protein